VGLWGAPAVVEQKNNDPLSLFVTPWTSDRSRAEKGAQASGLLDFHPPHRPSAKNCVIFQMELITA